MSGNPVKVPDKLVDKMLWYERELTEAHKILLWVSDSNDAALIRARYSKKTERLTHELGLVYKQINACLPVQPGYEDFVESSVDNA